MAFASGGKGAMEIGLGACLMARCSRRQTIRVGQSLNGGHAGCPEPDKPGMEGGGWWK